MPPFPLLIMISNFIGLPSILWIMSSLLLPQALPMVFFSLPQMLCSQSFAGLMPLHPSDLSSNVACLERPSLQVVFCPSRFQSNHITHSLFLPSSFLSLTEMFYVFVSFLVSVSLEEYKLFKSRDLVCLICACILSIWYEAWSRVDTKNSFEWYIAKLILIKWIFEKNE